MKALILGLCAVLMFVVCPMARAAIDFNNMNVASVAYGKFHDHYMGTRMATYGGSIFFSTFDDGSASPSKVLQYSPVDGLSNGVNHTVLADTTGKFTSLKSMDGLLYMADSLGNLRSYDGTTVNTLTGTPFSGTNYVQAMTEFNGKKYFGTTTGTVYEYDGLISTFTQRFQASGAGSTIVDLCEWKGSLYAAPWAYDGQLYKSNGTDLDSWQTVITGAYATVNGHLLPTPDYLYSSVINSVGWHGSTVRRSSDGETFTTIAGQGPFKWDYGALYYDGIAYFFQNGNAGGVPNTSGYLVTDDGITATTTSMGDWNWRIRSAVELDGAVYAIANVLDMNGNVLQDQYLLTTTPEPTTLIVWSLLGTLAITIGWWRWRKRAA